jgi:two-component system, NarL family, response regulator NreC
MDVSMPKLSGIEATRIIRRELPETRVIGLSVFEETESEQAMRDAGASDYRTKSGPTETLIQAIRACRTTVSSKGHRRRLSSRRG